MLCAASSGSLPLLDLDLAASVFGIDRDKLVARSHPTLGLPLTRTRFLGGAVYGLTPEGQGLYRIVPRSGS